MNFHSNLGNEHLHFKWYLYRCEYPFYKIFLYSCIAIENIIKLLWQTVYGRYFLEIMIIKKKPQT